MRGKISVKTDSSSSNNNNTNNKRAGTDSVYENVEFKRLQETAKTSTQAAAEVNEEVVNSDDTSDDDTKTTKLPPIIGMFKFLRAVKVSSSSLFSALSGTMRAKWRKKRMRRLKRKRRKMRARSK